MTKSQLLACSVIGVAALAPASWSGVSQTPEERAYSAALACYQRVLERVLPVIAVDRLPEGALWVAVLRIAPPSHREFRAAFVRMEKGATVAVSVPEGPILSQLAAMLLARPDLSVSEMAEKIVMQTRTISSAECPGVLQLAKRLSSLQVTLVPEIGVNLDSTEYRYLIQAHMAAREVTLQGPAEPVLPPQDPLVGWADDVRRRLEAGCASH